VLIAVHGECLSELFMNYSRTIHCGHYTAREEKLSMRNVAARRLIS